MNYKEKIIEGLLSTKKYTLFFLFWLALGSLMGIIGGAVGALFSKTLAMVTDLRSEHSYLIFFLPVSGIAIIAIYKLCRLSKAGTNAVFETVRDEKTVPQLLAPAVFAATALTHLFGGSAGREGAALQIGGSLAAFFGKLFRINEKQLHILTMCGMAALFSAVFGTPVGACIFAIEVASVGRLYTAAMFPCIVASSSAYGTALMLGITSERYNVGEIPEFGLNVMLLTVAIGVCSAVVGILFCTAMHESHALFKKLFKNQFLRVAVGGIIVVLLSLLVGNGDYNGSGAHIIDGIFEGHSIVPYAFLLKILFTAITMGSGYKGGEIVPTLFIGATLGGTVAGLMGASVPLGAAIGMVSLFSAVTNCPITAATLAFELFGGGGAVFYMTAITVSYLLSGNFSLYNGQKIVYSRLNDTKIKTKG